MGVNCDKANKFNAWRYFFPCIAGIFIQFAGCTVPFGLRADVIGMAHQPRCKQNLVGAILY